MRRAAVALALAAAAAGCAAFEGAGYIARAGWSEARILLRREPIAVLLERPDVDPALRERLALVLAVREFAADRLGLRVGDSYTTYAQVDHDATVHVLSAARRDRLEAHAWWYPVVGRLPYRGFFDRGAAERAGRRLEARGLDVDVRPAVAFSTLGWFADPLLSTAATGPPVEVAETVIHELFHSTLYVPGAAAFNESAATFVGHRGTIAFFCEGGADARCAEAIRRWRATRARGAVLARLARGLDTLYAAAPPEGARERGRAWLARAAARTLERQGLGAGGLVPPNNARLLGQLLYLRDLDAFERLAPDDTALGTAVASVIDAARGARDPFASVRALASGPERS